MGAARWMALVRVNRALYWLRGARRGNNDFLAGRALSAWTGPIRGYRSCANFRSISEEGPLERSFTCVQILKILEAGIREAYIITHGF